MSFNFDVNEALRKLPPARANAAKAANPDDKVSGISRISVGGCLIPEDKQPNRRGGLKALAWDYTIEDLAEMDRLLRQLAELEAWSPRELNDLLDQRQRMAPCRVRIALEQLRESVRRQLAPWPESSQKRSNVILCQFDRKRWRRGEDGPESEANLDIEPGAA